MGEQSVKRAGAAEPPRRSPIVARLELFDRLSAGGGVILVSAPAGSGKTVLLRSWIDHAGLGDRVAWVAVERETRDTQRFWLAVVGALRAAIGAGTFGDQPAPGPEFDGEAAVNRLLSGLAALGKEVLLVVDDLHELRSPEALAQLGRLLAGRPPLLRVALATRRDPQLGLHRLRLAGELTEVRASDLRFTPMEARQLLADSGVTLLEADLARLHARTEGWAAGLRLAALSLTRHPDPAQFVTEFSGSERTVFEYLLAEVLDHQPTDVRRLLLRTSILDRVSGALADELVGGAGSERILQSLEEANAFVIALDAGRTWFRYHHLFADLLRLELRRTEPELVRQLHRAASGWHAERGHVLEAIRHAQSAHDWPFAARLLGEHVWSLWLDGQELAIGALLAAFPVEARGDPALAPVVAADRLARGSLEELAANLASAERSVAAVPKERRPSYDASMATARLSLALRRGDLEAALDDVRPLLDPVGAGPTSDVAPSSDLRALALMQLGITGAWPGRHADAERHLQEALALARRIGRPYIEIGCLAHLAMGDDASLSAGRQSCVEAVALADRLGWGANVIVGVALARLGAYDAWQGRFDEAERWLDRATQVIQPESMPAAGLLLHLARAMAHLGLARFAAARDALLRAERLEELLVGHHMMAPLARQLLVQAHLQVGDTVGARQAVESLAARHGDWDEARVAQASLCLALGDARGASNALVPVLERFVATSPTAPTAPTSAGPAVIQALLIEAVARQRLGEAGAAEAALERALTLAAPSALVFPFVATPVREMLERHPRHRTAHGAFIASVMDVLAGSPAHVRRSATEAPADALSEGELRVLGYLPSNLAAHEIGSELFVSGNTVKTHMRHIYSKLGVHRRSEAVERARELGLLGRPIRTTGRR